MTSRRLLILLPTLFSLLVLTPVAASAFVDTAGTSHEAAVTALVDEGLVQGCETDLFCATQELTRGQMSTVLVRVLDLPAGQRGRFSDTLDTTHGDAADSLAEAGLVAGCGEGRFCPDAPVTRGQLSTMLQAAFAIPDAPADRTYFEDATGVHARGVRAIAEAGITAGCPDRLTAFCPGDGVQRIHAATFVARTLELVDRVELAPFAERKAEQDQIDAEVERVRLQEEAARAEAEAEAAAKAAAEANTPARIAVDVATAQLGKPYRWGASGPNSFDCSGLTSYAWAKAGVTLPRSSGAQFAGTERISRSQLRPGDLVFYHSPISHVAMYIGDGKVVEAPNSGNNVRIRTDGLTRRGVVGYGRP